MKNKHQNSSEEKIYENNKKFIEICEKWLLGSFIYRDDNEFFFIINF